ncbi:hypothetical protein [Paraburkholderia fungorum]|uniref:hypothetical protein n=1 Tax=Paraburkholderia fungorum TaxID=134537 RepID=UPI0038B7806E
MRRFAKVTINFIDFKDEGFVPFQPVSLVEDNASGKFPPGLRALFNQCGDKHYNGSLKVIDAHHAEKVIPIFHDECLENKRETYALLQKVRKAIRIEHNTFLPFVEAARSIHQNEHGYLPHKDDAPSAVGAPFIRYAAKTVGALPHNQAAANATNNGQFMEYTCQDDLYVECRFVVDYRFGFVYMTFGHYHRDSFALLIRSSAELYFEIMPTLPALKANYAQ